MFLINNSVLELKFRGEKKPRLDRKGNLAVVAHK